MRRVYIGGGISVAVAGVIAAILAIGEPAPVTCDQTITTRNALVIALGTTDSNGKTFCVSADLTGDPITVTTNFTSTTRFVAQPNDMTISLVPITINGADNLTFEGFDVPAGGFNIANGDNTTGLSFIGNYVHDFEGNGFQAFGGVTHANLTIRGNRIACVTYPAAGDPSGPAGYGIYSDATTENLDISYNTITGCGNHADGMQIGNIHGGSIANNVIDDIRWNGAGSNPHSDCLMVWAVSSDLVVENNRIFDCYDIINSPDGNNVTFRNNLIVGLDGGNSCVDAHPNGSSGAVHPQDSEYERNTIVVCEGSGILFDGGEGSRDGNVLDRNLLDGITCPATTDTFASVDHNLFLSANPCELPGTNTYSFSPEWTQTTNPAQASYYIPLNLPEGYADVGYTFVAAGYEATP